LTLVVIEEVEAADLIRTIVRAITSADTTVVGHRVEAFLIVDSGVDRAYRFAGREFAVLAGHRLKRNLRILGDHRIAGAAEGRSFQFSVRVVTIQADPVHLATAQDLILADDRD